MTRNARKARHLLAEVRYPREKSKKVLEVVSTHSSGDIRLPETIEGKILLDADELGETGATGISRILTFCGRCSMTSDQLVYWYEEKKPHHYFRLKKERNSAPRASNM